MDVAELLAQLRAEVAEARGMPMSASCVLNRAGVLEQLDAIAAALPDRLAEADRLLADRTAFLADARADAEQVRAAAAEDAEAELARSRAADAAQSWAAELRARTEAEIAARLAEAENELDGRLAEAEVTLERTLRLARSEADNPGELLSGARARLAELAEVVDAMLVGVRMGRERVHGVVRETELAERLDEDFDDDELPGSDLRQ
ncbi:MAG: hypothetical protein ACT4QG_18175 [Sporichthyaceae bacterium]